jgi:hypothetical protein
MRLLCRRLMLLCAVGLALARVITVRLRCAGSGV